MSDTIRPIHTLDARGHVFLEVAKETFGLNSNQIFREIQVMRLNLEDKLEKKGINYQDLRSALVPDRIRRDVAFIFDATETDQTWYGLPVFEKIFPLLNKKSNHSVLVGDYSGGNNDQDMLFEAFCEVVEPSREFEYKHSTLIYIIYINNLSDDMVEKICEGLKNFSMYVGFADLSYESKFKFLLSFRLSNLFLKYGSIIIQGDPDDEDCDDNVSGYPFEKYGYKCRTVGDIEFGVFLSYKIERPVFEGFQVDTEFSLNSISPFPLPLDDFQFDVTEDKLNYFKSAKSGSLERAGLAHITVTGLKHLIASKIGRNYVYSMIYKPEYDVTQFNIMLEVVDPQGKRTRLLAGLEYKPDVKTLRLITLF